MLPGTPNSGSANVTLDRCFQSWLNATEHDGMFDVILRNTNASILCVFPPEWTGFMVKITEACDNKCLVPPPIPLTLESCHQRVLMPQSVDQWNQAYMVYLQTNF